MIALLIVAMAGAGGVEGLTTGPAVQVADGFKFTEGPVWLPTEEWVFSDIPQDAIFKADKSVFRQPSGKSNGLGLDLEGRLIACEHGNRRVTRTEKDGTITVLADKYQGKRLNSPNDMTVRSDGTIYFTDPPYGLAKEDAELTFCGVYAISPDGSLAMLFDGFSHPNGLALSPDEKTLYLGNSQAGLVYAFDVGEDGSLSNGRQFAAFKTPDGMKMDAKGNLWSSSADGIRVYAPSGTLLGIVDVGGKATNCAFGGKDMKTLFVTTPNAVYTVPCAVKGLRPGHK